MKWVGRIFILIVIFLTACSGVQSVPPAPGLSPAIPNQGVATEPPTTPAQANKPKSESTKTLHATAKPGSSPSETPVSQPGLAGEATQPSGSEGLSLKVHDAAGPHDGQVPAPKLDGLKPRMSADGQYVEYIDPSGQVVLTADARALSRDSASEKELMDKLNGLYSNNEYVKKSIYPEYHYALPGADAIFYGLDQTISYNQFLLLKETLDLFNRPVFESMKSQFFGDGKAFLVVDKIGGSAAGVTFTGTGVVELDRKDLFSNKYNMASVIAHEASHVIQGPLADNYTCEDLLHREIGTGAIPDGFYNWTSDDLIQAIKDSKIGAYHVTLWVLYKLGIKDIAWVQQAILTGQVGGESVVNCKLQGL